ncbi:HIT family protein [Desulforhopalus sp. IMCC35007]|uniref:HIT family protein n=1 Tax=Desulforhopalus sp. IMCC35007 TaxID=2569543 RepID=UPI00352AAA23
MTKESIHSAKEGCRFCSSAVQDSVVAKYKTAMAIQDRNPVTRGHLLILPERHVVDYFLLTSKEKQNIDALLAICRLNIMSEDPTVSGFNVGVNCGESAGQTIFHCHVHLIPRRDGDTPSPRGGVRGVIPGKRDYPVSGQNM